jgi:hypothetical protein
VPGKRVEPVGRVDLTIYFGTPANFRKETLTFEVVGFHGTYHAILGCPCYTRFMAVPNYAYRPDNQPTATMSSPSLGEHCAGTVALVRHVPLGDGVPSATAIIASWG